MPGIQLTLGKHLLSECLRESLPVLWERDQAFPSASSIVRRYGSSPYEPGAPPRGNTLAMVPGIGDTRETLTGSAHTPCCHLKAHVPPLVGQCILTHNQHLPRVCILTPTSTETDPLKPSLCPWHWPDPEESKEMLDAGGKGGEG